MADTEAQGAATRNAIAPSPTASEAVLVANTPSFLFRRLREDPYVQFIASTHSADDLVRWFAAHADDPKDVHEVVVRYMCLAAISFKEPKEANEILKQISVRGLEWGADLMRMIASGIPTVGCAISPATRIARDSFSVSTVAGGGSLSIPPESQTPRIWTP